MELIKFINYTKVNAISWDVIIVCLEDREFETWTIHTCLNDDVLVFDTPGFMPSEITRLTRGIGKYLESHGQIVCTDETLGTYHLPVTHHYRIFQLSHNDPKLFARLDKPEDIDFGNYVCVWHGELNHEFTEGDLDQIYTVFNINHPYNFGGHSLSMSDIIEVFDADECFNKSNFRYFYCDSIGWAELPIKK